MALRGAFEELKNALKDLGSLETVTYRGELDAEIDKKPLDELADAIAQARTQGKLKLVLYTRLDGDGDSEHIFRSDDISQSIVDAHKSAFDMGREIRQGYLELFKEFAEGIIKE